MSDLILRIKDHMERVESAETRNILEFILELAEGSSGLERNKSLKKLFVKTLFGQIISLEVESSDLIKIVKQKIVKKGIPLNHEHLVYAGKKLEDNYTISEYNIQNESTIEIIFPIGANNTITTLSSTSITSLFGYQQNQTNTLNNFIPTQNNFSNAFGLQGVNKSSLVQSGTKSIPFNPILVSDSSITSGQLFQGYIQSVSAMEQYKHKSHEELRFEDYKNNQRGSNIFMAASSTPIGSSGFSPLGTASNNSNNNNNNNTSLLLGTESNTVYLLKLEDSKYYIGKTKNLNDRIKAHASGTASIWTKKYKLIEVLKEKPNASQWDELAWTLECMDIYGIENVRGSIYSQETLSSSESKLIKKQIRCAKNLCFRCGRDSHFISNCFANTDIDGNKIDDYEEDDTENVKGDKHSQETNTGSQFREPSTTSIVPSTTSNTFSAGTFRSDTTPTNYSSFVQSTTTNNNNTTTTTPSAGAALSSTFLFGSNQTSYRSTPINSSSFVQSTTSNNTTTTPPLAGLALSSTFRASEVKRQARYKKNLCFRCGRDSHFISNCYATYDADGSEIDDYYQLYYT